MLGEHRPGPADLVRAKPLQGCDGPGACRPPSTWVEVRTVIVLVDRTGSADSGNVA
jgi:hypothetical protein